MPEPFQAVPLYLNVLASSATGAIVISVTNPLDCVKQRWQVTVQGNASVQSTRPNGILSFARGIVVHEGLWAGLWRPGLLANASACSVSVGARIGLYPTIRDALAGNGQISKFASGLLGGMVGYLCAAPFFFASRVAQAEAGRGGSKGCAGIATLRRLATGNDGLFGLWRGAQVLVARGALMSGTQLATYDASKAFLVRHVSDGPLVHCGASAIASVALTTAICPLDVLLTTYQAGPTVLGREFASPLAAARYLVRERGPAVFVRGWLPLWGRFLPSSLLTFLIYEQIRFAATGQFL